MSYQARITWPLLIVTGRIGACGKMKRSARPSGSGSSRTMGTKSQPSAPRPCIQMTVPIGIGAGDELDELPAGFELLASLAARIADLGRKAFTTSSRVSR